MTNNQNNKEWYCECGVKVIANGEHLCNKEWVGVYLTPKEFETQLEMLRAMQGIIERDNPKEKLIAIRIEGKIGGADLKKLLKKERERWDKCEDRTSCRHTEFWLHEIRETRQKERQRICEELEVMKKCICSGGFMKKFNPLHRSDCDLKNKGYFEALTKAIQKINDAKN